ncbi:hypothetical protein BJ878DRAFT_545575 [Calycina marina]|uniref:Rhodopsin domain-containing protein n=1 Tax=Calycina marina TaxID=1763456 RepID=A0A9P8CDB3_9HELO|nr:hypothetical protein BJ878DRAFT_545575 [Calycina marina]
MEIPIPDGGDVNRGTSVILTVWILTGITGVVLLSRYGIKIWLHFKGSKLSSSRVWGFEDFLFALSYLLDVGQVALLQLSYQNGFGRHYYFLTAQQRVASTKWQFRAQPLAISATTASRTGLMWFLYQCFGGSNRKFQPVLVGCLAVHLIVNLVTILQILLQCGSANKISNRFLFFHLLWDGVPADGSATCQATTVQTTIGYVQGAFNTMTDFTIAYIAAFELWSFFLTGLRMNLGSITARFQQLDRTTRNRRIWQTAILIGPLILSGVASIVKTVLLGSIAAKLDFSWNIVPFMLWVKIENYSITIAACAPVLRTFFRMIDKSSGVANRDPAYGSHSQPAVNLSHLHRSHADRGEGMESTDNLQWPDAKSEECSDGKENDQIIVTRRVVVTTAERDTSDELERKERDEVVNGWQVENHIKSSV